MLLGPRDLLALLERRATPLREQFARLDRELGGELDHLPRVTLLETEYQRAVVSAELGWLDAVIADLRDGTLTWSAEELAEVARSSFSD